VTGIAWSRCAPAPACGVAAARDVITMQRIRANGFPAASLDLVPHGYNRGFSLPHSVVFRFLLGRAASGVSRLSRDVRRLRSALLAARYSEWWTLNILPYNFIRDAAAQT
jgi:hypothetical protein